jgi:hypothetical protein
MGQPSYPDDSDPVKFIHEMEDQLCHAEALSLSDALIVLNWVQWQIIHFMALRGAPWTVYTEVGAPGPPCPTCKPPIPG